MDRPASRPGLAPYLLATSLVVGGSLLRSRGHRAPIKTKAARRPVGTPRRRGITRIGRLIAKVRKPRPQQTKNRPKPGRGRARIIRRSIRRTVERRRKRTARSGNN